MSDPEKPGGTAPGDPIPTVPADQEKPDITIPSYLAALSLNDCHDIVFAIDDEFVDKWPE